MKSKSEKETATEKPNVKLDQDETERLKRKHLCYNIFLIFYILVKEFFKIQLNYALILAILFLWQIFSTIAEQNF